LRSVQKALIASGSREGKKKNHNQTGLFGANGDRSTFDGSLVIVEVEIVNVAECREAVRTAQAAGTVARRSFRMARKPASFAFLYLESIDRGAIGALSR
jgi:hypothetical protein